MLTEAGETTTGDASEDQAIRLRKRVIERLSPVHLQQWKTTTAQPALAWSPDSLIASCNDGGLLHAWNLATGTYADPSAATLAQTSPANHMPLPNDGERALAALWSPDGRSVLVHTRGFVSLWQQQKPLAKWQGKDLSRAWFDNAGHLFLRVGSSTLHLHPDGTTSEEATAEPLPPGTHDATLTVTADNAGLVHLWRGEPGTQEVFDPLPHPGPVVTTALDSTSRYLATITKDNTLRVWEIPTGLLVTPPLPLTGGDDHITWDDSRHTLVAWTDHEAVLFDW